MRLDMFLKTSRLVPRRSVAQEFCDAGLVTVNETAAKSSKEIKAGDVVEIRRASRSTKLLVVDVPATKQVSKNSAGELYQVLEENIIADNPLN
ncbi:MAG: S4 domain-containing protein [Acidobacteriota bacterium]